MIKIEKNIPFPVHREGHGYPWHTMSVNDSFVYNGNIRTAQQAALYYTRTTDKAFKARMLNYNVRVWRVE